MDDPTWPHRPPTPSWWGDVPVAATGWGPQPAPAPGPQRGSVAATVASVAALVGGLLATAMLLVLAFLGALCTLDAPCSPGEERFVSGSLIGAGVVFVGVPVLVSVARRDARWMLAPVAEVALVVLLGVVFSAR